MQKATKIMNILAGIIILLTGMYIGYTYQGVISHLTRFVITLLAVIYFCYQVKTELSGHRRKTGTCANQAESIQF